MDLKSELNRLKEKYAKAQAQLSEFKKLEERGLQVIAKLEQEQFNCPICLCSIIELKRSSITFKQLNCGHVFCKICQAKLGVCAICKTTITSRGRILL